MIKSHDQVELSAIEAKSIAQHIAFSPYIFQATVAMKELGILQFIDKKRKKEKKASTWVKSLRQLTSVNTELVFY